jgi:tetratricopeptide (TPR) repeat protein
MAQPNKKGNKPTHTPTPVRKTEAAPQAPLAPSGPRTMWTHHKLHLILVFLSGMMLYANSVANDYAMDDLMVITSNKFTARGVSGIPDLYKYDTFVGFFDDQKTVVAGGRYRPFTPSMFAVEVQLFAPRKTEANGQLAKDKDGMPFFYLGPKHKRELDLQHQRMVKAGESYIAPHVSHAINVLLYGLLCGVVYLFLLQLFNPAKDPDDKRGYFVALAASLLFAFHPLHTEAVANIKGRDEIMSLMGGLLSVYWMLKALYEPAKQTRYLVGASLAFLIGMLSKESTLTFLGVALISVFYFYRTQVRQANGDFALRRPDQGELTAFLSAVGIVLGSMFLLFLPEIGVSSILSKPQTFSAYQGMALLVAGGMAFLFVRMKTSPYRAILLLTAMFSLAMLLRDRALGDGRANVAAFETDELMNNPFLKLDEATQLVPLVETKDFESNDFLVAYQNKSGINAGTFQPISSSLKRIQNATKDTYKDMPGSEKLAMVMYTWGYYLKMLAVPHPLKSNYYPVNPFPLGNEENPEWGFIKKPVMTFGHPLALLSLVGVLALLGFAGWGLFRRNLYAWGILYYFGTFSVVSNLFFPIGANMSERFLFMPSLGFCAIAALGLYELAKRTSVWVSWGLIAVVLLLFGAKTFLRNFDWKEDHTLFMKDVKVARNDAKQLNAAGGSLYDFAQEELGRQQESISASDADETQKKALMDKAVAEYYARLLESMGYLERALRIHPGYSGAWLLYGNCRYHMASQFANRKAAAERELAAASGNPTLQVEKAQALASVYRETVMHYYAALSAYDQVAVFRDNHEDLNQNRGVCFMDLGNFLGEHLNLVPQAIVELNKSMVYWEKLVAQRKIADPSKDPRPKPLRLMGTAFAVLGQIAAANPNAAFPASLEKIKSPQPLPEGLPNAQKFTVLGIQFMQQAMDIMNQLPSPLEHADYFVTGKNLILAYRNTGNGALAKRTAETMLTNAAKVDATKLSPEMKQGLAEIQMMVPPQ